MHVGTVAIQLERGLARRVLPADDDHALTVVGMRLAVVVRHVRQVLARHAEQVRQAVVAHRQHHGTGVPHPFHPEAAAGRHGEPALIAVAVGLDRRHLLAQGHLQLEHVGDLAVVPQSFGPGRLLVGRRQGHSAHLEQLRGGEEHHIDGKAGDRIDQRALFEHLVVEAVMATGDGGGESRTGRPPR